MTDILSYGTNELFEEVARHEEMGSEIRALWPLQEIADKGLVEGFRKLVELYPSHIQKEDYLLIPMAEKMLSESEQEKLSVRFALHEATIGTDVHHGFEQLAGRILQMICGETTSCHAA